MNLQELIERLEKATGPDRTLDAEIACAVKFPDLRPATPADHLEFQHGHKPAPGYIWCPTGFLMADSYTRSIDAALTLVPEGLRWSCGFSRHVPHNAQVWTGTGFYEGECDSNRALALCIAALKARAALTSTDRSGGA